MRNMNPEVDAYYSGAEEWQDELATLRRIVLDRGLAEEWKWRIPVYTNQNKNVVAVSALKESCVLSFFKGVLLQDTHGILTLPGPNSRTARVIRFTSVAEIVERKPILDAYLDEAAEIEKAGLKVDLKESSEIIIPEELQQTFADDPVFQTAFESLTPGRQRGYLLHFSAPKQSKTRYARIEECLPRILDGKGLHDCTCGLSQRLPTCDGSHKSIR